MTLFAMPIAIKIAGLFSPGRKSEPLKINQTMTMSLIWVDITRRKNGIFI